VHVLQEGLHDSISSGVHALQDGVHVLQDSLQDSISTGVHVLQDGVHVLQDSLQDSISTGVHVLQDGVHALQDSVHAIQDTVSSNLHSKAERLLDNLHHLQDNVHHVKEQLNSQLHSAMAPVLQYPATRWPVYVYFSGAMTCLLTSSVCHLLGCCSKHQSQWLWRLDYSGIYVLLVASFFPPVYYGFLCQPFWRNFYLISTTIFGLVVLVVSLAQTFQQAKYRPFRAGLFAGLGMYGVVPIAHLYVLHHDIYHVRLSLGLDVIMGAIYLTGALVYALRVPERWHPGRFDLVFNSHQIFHVAVVAAALVHYYAITVLVEWRDASGGCAAPRGLSGPLGDVLQEYEAQGHALLNIEQVWELLRGQLHAVSGLAAAGAPGVAAAPLNTTA
jgi:adiponectin receptor